MSSYSYQPGSAFHPGAQGSSSHGHVTGTPEQSNVVTQHGHNAPTYPVGFNGGPPYTQNERNHALGGGMPTSDNSFYPSHSQPQMPAPTTASTPGYQARYGHHLEPNASSLSMSSDTTSQNEISAPDTSTLQTQLAFYKRRIEEYEMGDEERSRKSKKAKTREKPPERCFRKAVSLYVSAQELYRDWNDDYLERNGMASAKFRDVDTKRNFDRNVSSFNKLLEYIPRLQMMIDGDASSQEIREYLHKIDQGGNAARSDDCNHIKEFFRDFLNAEHRPEVLFTKERTGRGVQNDITGKYLCPIHYNWDDPSVCTRIRAGNIMDPKFPIFVNYYLWFLYPDGYELPPNGRVEHLFLRSLILVKVWCYIFTSPGSAEAIIKNPNGGPPIRNRAYAPSTKSTKTNVARLIGMTSVTAHSIAYTVIMTGFNLTDALFWTSKYNNFNFHALYDFIVDYFRESTPESEDLLRWWNSMVFPNGVGAAIDRTEASTNASYSLLEASRATASTTFST
uniref:Uncharacterized protein n=1 Tax=Psilocybe cubensis TaxID=181762 RepID=A0A8H7XQ47_PSICU